jgi:hypothetical protein
LEADQVALTSDLKISVFVKDAYLQWENAFPRNDFWFGIHPTPAFEVSEAAWAFRSLEKTIMDLRGIVPSRDFGVSLRGKFNDAGTYNYWVEAGNNSGNRPEVDKYKRFYFQFWGKPSEKFQFTVYHDRRGNPKTVDPNTTLTSLDNDIWVTAFFANLKKTDVYSLGFEAFFQNTTNGFIHGTAPAAIIDDKHGVGYSAWGWYSFTPKVGIVGRYDFLDPNTDSGAKGDARGLFIGSLFLKPIKNVYIMPNIYVEKYQKLPTGQTFKTSVTPRITLYYIFLS